MFSMSVMNMAAGSHKRVNGNSNLPILFVRQINIASQNKTLIIPFFPIKYAYYKVFIVSSLDCNEIMEDISPQLV